MNDSESFQSKMSLFFRASPLVAKIDKCDKCFEYHIVSDDLIYCTQCHYPMEGCVPPKVHSTLTVVPKWFNVNSGSFKKMLLGVGIALMFLLRFLELR